MAHIKLLDKLLLNFMERKQGPRGCSCMVWHKGKLLYSGYFGFADQEQKKSVEPDTIFRIFSMSKVITCVAALKLYEKGLFLLNDPLKEYLPEHAKPFVCKYTPTGEVAFVPAAKPILVKDLFTMTSGFTYPDPRGSETERQTFEISQKLGPQGSFNIRDFSRALAQVPLAFEPGEHWKYGLSHDLLGAFIEAVTGDSFGLFLKREIFDPLGMKDTGFKLKETDRPRLCVRYDRSEDGSLFINDSEDGNLRPESQFESGGGGLLSTLDDYSRFTRMLAQGGELDGERILGRKTLNLMATNALSSEALKDFSWPYLTGYGYGLGVRTLINPALGGINGTLGELGWSGLLGTWMMADSTEELSAVYMQQMYPNQEAYQQPRLRSVIYGAI